ncbi:unnamed protein product [Adineta steineri]|uniref:Interferon-induced transmembrane protein n=1 Tax=Adineta steineri TaxID=433720 RepID=A0A818RIP7_9BILA|nr:unnamed protein product [Adineta steineri]CAF1245722.1 unnamed protein product [Adineta steineri]CAF3654483.1 unnamed protein product [Adineta steineri]CAF4015879.1 unnamed protein product [Adineta steineri]
MTSPNYSDPSRAATYTAPEQAQSDQKPYMQPQIQYVPQPNMQQGGPVPFGQQPGGQIYIMPNNYIDPSIAQIRDWLPWSITNIFIGWCLLGFLPLIFSLICRSRKTSNDASGARTMSTLALNFNILVTLVGLAAWIGLIIALVAINKSTSNVTCYPYC